MPYAINVADLTKYANDFILISLLKPVLDTDPTSVVTVNQKIDEIGARFTCNEEQSAAIVEIIRKKLEKYQLRIYHSATGKGWKRV